MGYRKPEDVVAPKSRWEIGKVLFNTGQGGWSAAQGVWDGEPALGIRWNGDDDSGGHGSPQSHGNPTWFIVPNELEEAVRNVAHNLNDTKSFVACTISKPEDFSYGVFRIHVEVTGTLREQIAGRDIPFDIPKLQNRFFRSETGYWTHPGKNQTQPRGQIKGGEWNCIVQTNGIEEDENPTKMDVVRDALIANILRALDPYKQPEAYSSQTRRAIT